MNGQQKYQPAAPMFELLEGGRYEAMGSVITVCSRYDTTLSYNGDYAIGFRPALFL